MSMWRSFHMQHLFYLTANENEWPAQFTERKCCAGSKTIWKKSCYSFRLPSLPFICSRYTTTMDYMTLYYRTFHYRLPTGCKLWWVCTKKRKKKEEKYGKILATNNVEGTYIRTHTQTMICEKGVVSVNNFYITITMDWQRNGYLFVHLFVCERVIRATGLPRREGG